jgi:Na+-transporting NADH:ubiquinone oxidoreductase subunit NqrC
MSVMYVLTEQEKLWLMDKPTASLDRIMNMVHCGEYDFKNVIITNLTKKYAYKYDKSAKNFTKVDKTILLDAIVSGRVADLEEIYKEFVEQKKLTYKKQVEFKQHLDKLLDDDIAVYDNKRNIKLQDVQYVQGERRQRVVIQKPLQDHERHNNNKSLELEGGGEGRRRGRRRGRRGRGRGRKGRGR